MEPHPQAGRNHPLVPARRPTFPTRSVTAVHVGTPNTNRGLSLPSRDPVSRWVSLLSRAVRPRDASGFRDDGFGLDLDQPAGIEQLADDDHRARRPDLAEHLPVGAPDRLPVGRAGEVGPGPWRTARENPITASNGESDDTRRRSSLIVESLPSVLGQGRATDPLVQPRLERLRVLEEL